MIRRRTGRNWHEMYLLGLSAATGLAGLLAPDDIRSRAIEASFPHWGQTGWYAGLLLGAAAGIVGILMGAGMAPEQAALLQEEELRRQVSRQLAGMSMERASMLLLTGLCVAYVLGAVAISGPRAATALGVSYVAAFALANAARARQIRLTLGRVRERSARPADPGGER